jgi:hypothetical protein
MAACAAGLEAWGQPRGDDVDNVMKARLRRRLEEVVRAAQAANPSPSENGSAPGRITERGIGRSYVGQATGLGSSSAELNAGSCVGIESATRGTEERRARSRRSRRPMDEIKSPQPDRQRTGDNVFRR